MGWTTAENSGQKMAWGKLIITWVEIATKQLPSLDVPASPAKRGQVPGQGVQSHISPPRRIARLAPPIPCALRYTEKRCGFTDKQTKAYPQGVKIVKVGFTTGQNGLPDRLAEGCTVGRCGQALTDGAPLDHYYYAQSCLRLCFMFSVGWG